MNTQSQIVIVMGVAGCGKTTVAEHLAHCLGAGFCDGDDHHPTSNIEKMSSGVPLTDEDRFPWLERLRDHAIEQSREHQTYVIACSALKRRYRDVLNQAGRVFYVFLDGSRELIHSRMHLRTGHFMPESLLDSQFEALEDPRHEENVVTVGIDPLPDAIAINAAVALNKLDTFYSSDRSTGKLN